ncbi:nucleotidyltransferase domain-containing protein [Vannielia litorea]|uniref:nucleotidyltransferase domain-containing protein n=1 Tax=Vannielia litorea TaxID=1217970 RepID=UPI001C95A6B7|nr:nucleotidyltransferase domain-containing protein [Vannielia litorea]MBY6047989.1 nucleotidyltransferase domain-containing protein [Vannielia litorea]MBY6075403.1 nucleotidyltransferase domain-containing protein [Vannielia litorea]
MTWLTHPDAPLIRTLTEILSASDGLESLFLGGSHGRGTADAYSDIDLVAVARPGDEKLLTEALRGGLPGSLEPVLWQVRFDVRLVNAITPQWRRIDLSLPAREHLLARASNTLLPLHDPDGLHAMLAPPQPLATPSPQRVSALTREFLRVLGLLHVGMGRKEWVLLVKGAGLLRDMLVDLMLEEVPEPEKGGILHLSRLLPTQDMAQLTALPYPGPDRAELLAAYTALAGAFLPRARSLHIALGLSWPEAFEAATRDLLRRELSLELP